MAESTCKSCDSESTFWRSKNLLFRVQGFFVRGVSRYVFQVEQIKCRDFRNSINYFLGEIAGEIAHGIFGI